MNRALRIMPLGLLLLWAATASAGEQVEANRLVEIDFASEKTYQNPFLEVTLDAVVTRPDGTQQRVPAFWAGGKWTKNVRNQLCAAPGTDRRLIGPLAAMGSQDLFAR